MSSNRTADRTQPDGSGRTRPAATSVACATVLSPESRRGRRSSFSYLLHAHCTRVRTVRLGAPVISPQNLSPAFAPRPLARPNVVISSNSLSCPSCHTVDPLLEKEVVDSVHHGNKKAAFYSDFLVPDKPSNGLEPLTPSLPWRLTCSAAGRSRRASCLALRVFMPFGGSRGPVPGASPSNPETTKNCPQDLSPRCCLVGQQLVVCSASDGARALGGSSCRQRYRARRLHPPLVHPRRAHASQDGGEHASGAAGAGARRARPEDLFED
jgi:hypothetical protein